MVAKKFNIEKNWCRAILKGISFSKAKVDDNIKLQTLILEGNLSCKEIATQLNINIKKVYYHKSKMSEILDEVVEALYA